MKLLGCYRSDVYEDFNFSISYTKYSVVPSARHCGIPAILPLMSLKNAPSAGLRARPKNLLIFRYLNPVPVFGVTY